MERTPENLQKLKLLVNSFNSFVVAKMINKDFDFNSDNGKELIEIKLKPKMADWLVTNEIEDLYEIDDNGVIPLIVERSRLT